MTQPTITVVMPNYNHAQFLPTSVRALMERERIPDELIIIDDCSSDHSWEVISAFARQYPQIRPYRNDRNLGVLATLNRGLDLAQSDFFYGAGADDYVRRGFIEKSMALLANHPQAGLCCTIGDWRELDTGLRWFMGIGMTNTPAYLSPLRMVELERAGRFFIPGHTVIAKRSAVLEAGKFPLEVRYAGDWFVYNLIGFQYGICVVPEPLAVFQSHPNSSYRRGRRDKTGDLKVMAAIVRLLQQSSHQDAVERMRRSGSLYVWGFPMLKVLCRHREFRPFLTPAFLRKNACHSAKLFLKRIGPNWLKQLYLRTTDQASPTSGDELEPSSRS
jgi:glycosyltransferase involved in cell wall biosynthesis